MYPKRPLLMNANSEDSTLNRFMKFCSSMIKFSLEQEISLFDLSGNFVDRISSKTSKDAIWLKHIYEKLLLFEL